MEARSDNWLVAAKDVGSSYHCAEFTRQSVLVAFAFSIIGILHNPSRFSGIVVVKPNRKNGCASFIAGVAGGIEINKIIHHWFQERVSVRKADVPEIKKSARHLFFHNNILDKTVDLIDI